MLFVVDENIPYHAVGHIDETFDSTQVYNDDAAIFFETLAARKHQMGISDELQSKYEKALDVKMPKRAQIYFDQRMLDLIRNLISDSTVRVIPTYPIPNITDQTYLPKKDVFIVELALHLNCNVVTHDVPLYKAIKKRTDLPIDSLRAREATSLM